jgi:uncharacterized protein (DUF362 family)
MIPIVGLTRCEAGYSEKAVCQGLQRLFGVGDQLSNGPFAGIITEGDRVAIKPNWVLHQNHSGRGLDCLVTNTSVLSAVLDGVLHAKPERVVVGDAPIQGCDLPQLMAATGILTLKDRFEAIHAPVTWKDFRRTVLDTTHAVWKRQTDLRPLDDYVLFDLAEESLLEPIVEDYERFRVTMYNPDLMQQTHAPGKHQYLVARDVIEADVVVNLPKLKTHKKAGITGALKNLVGINGNKDYLPHHRRGGTCYGGDCYAGGNPFKYLAETCVDSANRREGFAATFLRTCAAGSYMMSRITGSDNNLEGNWRGNDTIWRTCLDLNRILLYGRPDGTMADQPQRKVVSITDAIICGEGEGPLASTPRPLGFLSMALNSVAAEYVHAHLMQFDWRKVPIIREAFGHFRYPLCDFLPEDIEVELDGQRFAQPWPLWNSRPFIPAAGWRGIENGVS